MANEKITILEKDGKEHDIVHVGKTILDSALAFQFPVPYQCRQGDCGTCKAKLMEGEVTYIRNVTTLTDDEITDNVFLACSCCPKTDLKISFLNSQDADNIILKSEKEAMISSYDATITSCEKLPQNIYIIWLKLDKPLNYKAGQYLDFSTDTIKSRSFSIASSNDDKTEIEFQVRHYAGGEMSGFFASNPIGQKISLSGPFGSLTYEHIMTKPKLLALCAGVGFSPVKNIILQLLKENPNHHIEMIYILRNDEDIYDKETIDKFQQAKNVQITYQNRRDSAGNVYDISKILVDKYNDLSDYAIYCAGSVNFVNNAREGLQTINNYDEDYFYADGFSATGDHDDTTLPKKSKKGFFSRLFS